MPNLTAESGCGCIDLETLIPGHAANNHGRATGTLPNTWPGAAMRAVPPTLQPEASHGRMPQAIMMDGETPGLRGRSSRHRQPAINQFENGPQWTSRHRSRTERRGTANQTPKGSRIAVKYSFNEQRQCRIRRWPPPDVPSSCIGTAITSSTPCSSSRVQRMS